MKAFVRFTHIASEEGSDCCEQYVAYHQPDHNSLPLVAAFFSRRFKSMNWTIMTPRCSATWDGSQLLFGAGVSADQKPEDDQLVQLWRDYYKSTFNPARVKTAAMKREMPVRFWKNLPEATLIPELLANAPRRVVEMQQKSAEMHRSAIPYLPVDRSLSGIAAALQVCRGCDLCDNGTNVVPGIGPFNSRLMIIGEQPGDVEEQEGIPFVGPAGELLNELMAEAGLDRTETYVTNVVKHFHHELRGKRRLHQRPSARHESACKPWLVAEVEAIQPRVVLGLGTTAMHALLGRQVKIGDLMGTVQPSWASQHTVVSWHPASILRTSESIARQRRAELLQTLVQLRAQLSSDKDGKG